MNQIAETEQWLLDGDCDKCRKEKYCDKDCTAYKKYINMQFKKAMDHAFKALADKHEQERKEKEQNEQNSQI